MAEKLKTPAINPESIKIQELGKPSIKGKEIMKNEKEKTEIKLKIIENIVQLKAKIQDYKKLSKNLQ